jgi:hypothetical protein
MPITVAGRGRGVVRRVGVSGDGGDRISRPAFVGLVLLLVACDTTGPADRSLDYVDGDGGGRDGRDDDDHDDDDDDDCDCGDDDDDDDDEDDDDDDDGSDDYDPDRLDHYFTRDGSGLTQDSHGCRGHDDGRATALSLSLVRLVLFQLPLCLGQVLLLLSYLVLLEGVGDSFGEAGLRRGDVAQATQHARRQQTLHRMKPCVCKRGGGG